MTTLPEVGPVREIEFTADEARYLYGLCASVSSQCKSAESKAVWALLARKVSAKTLYSEVECNLLSKAIDTTLSAGDNVLSRTQDLEARVRAQAVVSMFRTIKAKVAVSHEGSTNGPKAE